MTAALITKKYFECERPVFIEVEGRSFLFGLEMLTKISPYFKAMFNGAFIESGERKVILPNVYVKEFQFFRNWVFGLTNKEDDLDVVLQVAVFADRFIIDQLKQECYNLLRTKTDTLDFALQVLETGVLTADAELKSIFPYWLNNLLNIPVEWTLRLVEHRSEVLENLQNELDSNEFVVTMSESALREVKKLFAEYSVLLLGKLSSLKNEVDKLKLAIFNYQELKNIMNFDYIEEPLDIYRDLRIENRQNKEKLEKILG